MAVFLTGGAGKTSRRIAAELAALSPTTPVLTSSRSAPEVPDADSSKPLVRFDWFDSETYANPFTHPAVQGGSGVSAIYIVLPPSNNPLPEVQSFVRVALEHRGAAGGAPLTLVLLSSDTIEADATGPTPHSRVHAYLQSLSAARDDDGGAARIRYAVLRPSFFMENFTEHEHHRATIAGEGKVRSATGEGREAFISAEDIAAVAARCLLGRVELNADYIINGPEHLTYGDIARTVGQVTGKHVTHTDLTTQQLADNYVAGGLPREYATVLAGLDERIKNGYGRPPNDTVEKVTGRKGVTFAQMAEMSKSAWA